MHAQQISGMPMNTTLWIHDPPASSYPACIAVKCATLQSDSAGERYLRLLREAVMLEGKNIAKESALMEIAQQLSEEAVYNFDVSGFQFDWQNDNGLEAFRKDLQEVQYRNISRFPTMIIKAPGEGGLIATGYRPYSDLLKAIQQVAPGLQKTHQKINEEDYKNYWGSLTTREIKEISEIVI
jgi:predicted DsbA family dithiol-disulfide isomerase